MAARTPSFPKRGMSAASRICACSMRKRGSFAAGCSREGRLVGVEDDPVGAVADRVGADLEAVGEGEARGLQDPLGRRHEEARVAGVVRVRLEERGAARAERAVGVELHRADGQHPAGRGPAGRGRASSAGRRPSRRGACAACPGGGRAPGRGRSRRCRRPASVRLVTPFARHSSIASSSARRTSSGERSGGSTSPSRVVDEDAGRPRPPASRMISPPAGAFVARVIPCERHRLRVGEHGVAVGALEDDRVVGRDGGERVVGREAADGPGRRRVPLALVPAAAADPLAGPARLHGLRHPLDHLGVAARAHEVHVEAREADPEQVRVRVVEAGDDGAAREVEDARLRAHEGLHVGVRAHRDDRGCRARPPPRRAAASRRPCGRRRSSGRGRPGSAAQGVAREASRAADTARHRAATAGHRDPPRAVRRQYILGQAPGEFDTFLFADYSGAAPPRRRAIALWRLDGGRPRKVAGPRGRRCARLSRCAGRATRAGRRVSSIDHHGRGRATSGRAGCHEGSARRRGRSSPATGAAGLSCADLDHLVFRLGDAAVTRRARKALHARRRRPGVEPRPNALRAAGPARRRGRAARGGGRHCLADEDARRDGARAEALRRAEQDGEFVARFAARVRELFPQSPEGRGSLIAQHACEKYSGRVGRSAAAQRFDDEAVRLAVVAHVRHRETAYDELPGVGRGAPDARALVRGEVAAVLERWSRPTAGSERSREPAAS